MANLSDIEEKSENLDLTSIFRLFATTFAFVTASTLAVQYFRQGHHVRSEIWDDSIYIFALLSGLYLAFKIVRRNKIIKSHWVLSICALVGIVLGIGGIDHPELANQIWGGFGPWALIIAITITPWVWRIIRFRDLNSLSKYLLGAIIIITFLLSLLSMYQGMNSIINSYHTSYIINESLSVVAGHWPYVDFIPQYQMGSAFFLALFKSFLTTNQLIGLGLVFMSAILITAIVVGVIIVKACLPNHSIFAATALVVPITCVTPFPERIGYPGSITEFFSAIPVRIFPGVIILGVVSWILGRSEMKISKLKNGMTYVGLICGLVLWNTQDFGIAMVVSVFAGLLVLKILSVSRTKFILARWSIGLLMGFMLYPMVSLIFGKRIHISYYAFFVRQYSAGYGSEPIQIPGPVLLILPLIISILICSIWILKQSKLLGEPDRRNLQFTGTVSLLFSIWSTLGFCYYLNRSYASGQLQILLLPIAIAFGAMVGAILQLERLGLKGEDVPSLFDSFNFLQWKGLLLWPISLIASLTFASILLTPNPRIELQRLSGESPPSVWSLSNMKNSINDANAGISFANSLKATVGFLGISGNYVQLETGIESASIFNSPDDATSTLETDKIFCTHLTSLHLDYLVLGEGGPAEFYRYPDKILCGTYTLMDVPGVRAGHMAKLINN